jgi:hypothetical protein
MAAGTTYTPPARWFAASGPPAAAAGRKPATRAPARGSAPPAASTTTATAACAPPPPGGPAPSEAPPPAAPPASPAPLPRPWPLLSLAALAAHASALAARLLAQPLRPAAHSLHARAAALLGVDDLAGAQDLANALVLAGGCQGYYVCRCSAGRAFGSLRGVKKRKPALSPAAAAPPRRITRPASRLPSPCLQSASTAL